MKHIVLVLGAYYPRFAAVGICAYQIVDVLKKDFKVSVVAIADDYATEPHLVKDGVNIYRVVTPEITKRSSLAYRLRTSSGVSVRMQMFLLRARATLRRLCALVTIDRDLVNAYKKKLEQLPEIDVIVPLVFPMESVLASLEYASVHGGTVVPYLFDNFVDSRSLHVLDIARKFKRRRHLALEANMLERSAAIFAMYPLRPHFLNNFGAAAERKLTFLEHPLLVRNEKIAGVHDGSFRFVYTGALVRKVREPDYVLELIRKLDLGKPASAEFYVMGSAAARIETATTDSGIAIRNHGQVDKNEANAAVAQGSILLNIGEVEGKQISSKIFEYMGAGKPIVHFAYTKDDVVIKILNKYPLALSLVQDPDQMEENRGRFRDFVLANSGKSMKFDEVAAIFPEALPETSARLITDLLWKTQAADN